LSGQVNVGAIESAYEAWKRQDVEALLEATHPDVEIAPLVIGVTSSGPWSFAAYRDRAEAITAAEDVNAR
jgi:hypothetical protein